MSNLDKGFRAAIAFYVASVLFTSIMIIGYATAVKDVSWIGKVENFIKKENWEPDREYIPLSDCSFFLYENGEEEYFYLNSQSEFINYIKGLMGRVDKQVRSSIPRDTVDEILSKDRVMVLVHRFPTGFGILGILGRSEVAYLILEDRFGEGREGTIIMQDYRAGEYSHYSIWQITDHFLW